MKRVIWIKYYVSPTIDGASVPQGVFREVDVGLHDSGAVVTETVLVLLNAGGSGRPVGSSAVPRVRG